MTIVFHTLASAGSMWNYFSGDPVKFVLEWLVMLSPIILVVAIYRRMPLRPPYFSGLFILTLVPVIFDEILTIMNLRRFIGGEDMSDVHYIIARLQSFIGDVEFGFMWSALSILIYTVFYFVSRKNRARERAKQTGRDG